MRIWQAGRRAAGGSVMPFATDPADTVPVTMFEFVAFWFAALYSTC